MSCALRRTDTRTFGTNVPARRNRIMSAPSPVERAAMIVRGDDASARSELAAIVTSLEERYSDPMHVVRRHAAAAQAWLEGNPRLALERYGAIVVDRPHDLTALEA